MRGSHIAALAALIVFQGVATAGFCQPSPPNCTLPTFIRLVGRNDGTPDPGGLFSVVVRDAANNPMPGANVSVDFTACTGMAAAAPNCPGIVTAVTDNFGVARFTVMGSVISRSGPEPVSPCAMITANNVPLGNRRVSAFDQDGVNGLRAMDISLFFQCDLVSGLYHQRSDFNGDGSLSTLDLTMIAGAFFSRGSSMTAARCDGFPTQNVTSAPVGGLSLRWDDCPSGAGVVTKTFACGVNTGFNDLVASLVAPAGVTELFSYEAELEVVGEGGAVVPDWWRLGTGGCRSGALQTMAPAGTTCEIVELSAGQAAVDFPFPPAINYEGIRVLGTSSVGSVALQPGTEYELFRLRINHTKTVGAGACSGCAAPVMVILKSLRLIQGSCADPALTTSGGAHAERAASHIPDMIVTEPGPYVSNLAYWQGVPGGVLGVPRNTEGVASLALLGPNPGRGPFALSFTLPRAGQGTLAIYDVSGRKVRGLRHGWLKPGMQSITWDGRDESGADASAGVYVVRLSTEDITVARTLVRLK